ncbi:SO2930 family diheme c-type cytochrome [Shewanella woodyi]|uniref:SO2930 family diheme c-type cytochrome n=1 Tax=Shewanella woodyi TaxID=60961 RepID=UPI0007F8C23C|nr:SO2930 family diheme c-type cytochrome [Shewanella woodyi]
MRLLAQLIFLLLFTSACGGGDSDSQVAENPTSPSTETPEVTPATRSLCEQTTSSVNWEALMNEDCDTLSQYGLFIDPISPTSEPVSPGLAYELSTQLFTNYANKHRFIFIPEGKKANYHPTDAFQFPVGTVLTKTFSMPYDTQVKGAENEIKIETRLLIHRKSGWTTLPYLWQEGKAKLTLGGADIPHTLNHQGEVAQFDYHVPSRAECKLCHQINRDGESKIAPIGLKAHLLNTEINYQGQTVNQLQLWADKELLGPLPNITEVASAPSLFNKDADLTQRVKGYLDINCAHCHRAEGFASISGLRLGFHIDHTSYQYGVCKKPPGWDGGAKGLSFDLIPGDGEHSILLYRQELNNPKDRMPPIGRSLVHQEAVILIKQWIDSLPPSLGNCQS